MSHPTKCRLCGKPRERTAGLCDECSIDIGDIVKRRDHYDHHSAANVVLNERAIVVFLEGPAVRVVSSSDATQFANGTVSGP